MELIEKVLEDRVVGNNPNLVSQKVRHIILHNPLRQYFVNMVKAPLLKAIISLAEKYPEPTKENTDSVVAHALIDCFASFKEHNKVRPALFHAVSKVIPDEVEHDSVYSDLFQVFLEYIIESILAGTWQPRPLGKPAPRYWSETPPYGGENSIIYKLLQHKDEIKKILEID